MARLLVFSMVGVAVAAMVLRADPSEPDCQSGCDGNSPAVLAQFGGASSAPPPSKTTVPSTPPGASTVGSASAEAATTGSGGNAGSGSKPDGSRPSGSRTWELVPDPPTKLQMEWTEVLDRDIAIEVSGVTVAQMFTDLRLFFSEDVPSKVLIDHRAIEFAQTDLSRKIEFESKDQPLRLALVGLLAPMNLRAVVMGDGLLVTADFVALTRQGLGVDQWINVNEEFAERVDEAMDKKVSVSYTGIPLGDATTELSAMSAIPMVVDVRALEEIGLSAEETVDLTLDQVSLESVLREMLAPFDLTVSLRGEVLRITTNEAAEEKLLQRIYWLEGVIDADRQLEEVIDQLQTSFEPDHWEAIGGNGTMREGLRRRRPALTISANYWVHRQIEKYFRTVRDNSFGPMPFSWAPDAYFPHGVQSYLGGGGGGGGGGFGGGGGGFGWSSGGGGGGGFGGGGAF